MCEAAARGGVQKLPKGTNELLRLKLRRSWRQIAQCEKQRELEVLNFNRYQHMIQLIRVVALGRSMPTFVENSLNLSELKSHFTRAMVPPSGTVLKSGCAETAAYRTVNGNERAKYASPAILQRPVVRPGPAASDSRGAGNGPHHYTSSIGHGRTLSRLFCRHRLRRTDCKSASPSAGAIFQQGKRSST
jgi:hypothetical protein